MAAVVSVAVVAADPVSAQTAFYRVTPLVELGDNVAPSDSGQFGTLGINNKGQAVYTYEVGNLLHLWLWLPEPDYDRTAGFHDLSAELEYEDDAIGREINESGYIAGVFGSGNARAATIWRIVDDETIDEQSLEDTPSEAFSINDSSPPNAVGWYDAGVTCTVERVKVPGFVWPWNGSVTDLVGISSEVQTRAYDIGNDDDETIAGESAPCDHASGECPTNFRGTAWDDFANTGELDSGDIYSGNDPVSRPRGADDNGRLAGFVKWQSSIVCYDTAAFWESPSDTDPVHLGGMLPCSTPETPELCDETITVALTSATNVQVVGWNDTQEAGWLWHRESGNWSHLNLNSSSAIPSCSSSVWTIRQAHDINENSWIIAWGERVVESDVQRWALLLTPVGECPADVNRSGCITSADLDVLYFSSGCEPGRICYEDVNNDCQINSTDFAIVTGQLNLCCEEEEFGGGGPSQEWIQIWADSGGWEAFQNSQITSEQIETALLQSTPEDCLAALFELLTQ